jgi:hypothetical protein
VCHVHGFTAIGVGQATGINFGQIYCKETSLSFRLVYLTLHILVKPAKNWFQAESGMTVHFV